MTTTNRLCYTVSKRYIQAGTTFKINVKILLADDCKNNICDWSITADIYEQRKNGRFVWCAGGCCHEEILKRFPQFNWKDYETKVTENDFNKFVSSVNRSLLPVGITFKMK